MNGKRKKAPALDYRLDVQDFGPIARASVEMRPLTVFIGPSNTGKSYLAMLLYVLHRCLCSETGGRWQDRPVAFIESSLDHPLRRRAYFGGAAWRQAGEDSKVREALTDWIASFLANDSPPPLPDELLKHIQSHLEQPRLLEAALDHELRRCFGVHDLRSLARQGGAKKPTVAVSGPPATQPQSVEVALYEFKLAAMVQLAGNLPLDLLAKSLTESVQTERSFFDGLGDLREEDRASIYFSRAIERAIHHSLGAACRQAHYLPADRTGVMHSHQVVVGALVQSAPMAGIRPAPTMPTLTGVLADFLYQLINIGAGPPGGHGSDLAKQLEESLLAGSVRAEASEANYPSFLYRPRGWEEDLPLMRTSSMVSELAPVVLYLRHVVQAGEVLIVEEPEAHLHPAMQAAFARELARLVRGGVRIVLTTHSEWLLEQIGNLVRLSALPKGRRSGIGGAEVALEPSQVGAWLFKPSARPRGSIVQEVKLDPQTGLFATDFDDVSMALYNDGAEIFNRLQEEQER